jgi:uncharacterized membrane protein SirB2
MLHIFLPVTLFRKKQAKNSKSARFLNFIRGLGFLYRIELKAQTFNLFVSLLL